MIWERLVSNAVKEHWKKTGFEPCDGLKAAIIFNSPMSEGEKNAAYEEILCDMNMLILTGARCVLVIRHIWRCTI